MKARIIDCFDLIFNRDVIKEQSEEDKQYEEALKKIGDLERDIDILTKSRNRYLQNCKKKTEKIKELKAEIKQLKKH